MYKNKYETPRLSHLNLRISPSPPPTLISVFHFLVLSFEKPRCSSLYKNENLLLVVENMTMCL